GISLVFAEQLKFDIPFIYLVAVLIAAVSAASSGIVVKYFPRSHPISTNAVGMPVAAIVLFILTMISGEKIQMPTLLPTWLALGWLVTSSIVGFVLMVWVLSRWTASATSYSSVLSPLVTVTVASVLAGEQVTPAFLLGALLVLVGVYIGVLSPQK
ncbi:MAG TPA: EamA family transporter, partial [Anaerolineales bacterium]|nr:EamA family transporter [Anaerolineales bacterium]